jgi:hypothetical protein
LSHGIHLEDAMIASVAVRLSTPLYKVLPQELLDFDLQVSDRRK